jgi:flavin reductase (DIM6/NTAB) family NADH-FMN oxidoreductase RutF
MRYAASDLTPHERFKMLASFVVPRPIAWVTTIAAGVVNAAPFSFFNVVADDPPLCVIGINPRSSGGPKDTFANIQRSGEFVVNVADESLAEAMHESSGDFPPDTSGPAWLGLALTQSTDVKAPRLAGTPWAMECRTWKIIPLNGGRQLIIGEAICFHVRDGLWDPAAMRIDMEKYHAVGRMFADRYCRTNDRVEFAAARGIAPPLTGKPLASIE